MSVLAGDLIYCSRRQSEQAEQDFGARRVELETLLAECDVLSLHLPGTEQTRHLIGARLANSVDGSTEMLLERIAAVMRRS